MEPEIAEMNEVNDFDPFDGLDSYIEVFASKKQRAFFIKIIIYSIWAVWPKAILVAEDKPSDTAESYTITKRGSTLNCARFNNFLVFSDEDIMEKWENSNLSPEDMMNVLAIQADDESYKINVFFDSARSSIINSIDNDIAAVYDSTEQMKVWLDDNRPAPSPDFIRFNSVPALINFFDIYYKNISEVSLDYDLGSDKSGNDFLNHILNRIKAGGDFSFNSPIFIHSLSPEANIMRATLLEINKFRSFSSEESPLSTFSS